MLAQMHPRSWGYLEQSPNLLGGLGKRTQKIQVQGKYKRKQGGGINNWGEMNLA